MSLLSKPAPSIKIDLPRPSLDESSTTSAEPKTPLSPTDSTLTSSGQQINGVREQEAVVPPQAAARLGRRHTVFVPSNTLRNKINQDDEEDGDNLRESDAESSEAAVRLTQSLPQMLDSEPCGSGLGEPEAFVTGIAEASAASLEYRVTMEEVQRQREQLLAFHKQQREEQQLEEEEELKREGSGEDDDHTEDMHPLEGTHMCTHSYMKCTLGDYLYISVALIVPRSGWLHCSKSFVTTLWEYTIAFIATPSHLYKFQNALKWVH